MPTLTKSPPGSTEATQEARNEVSSNNPPGILELRIRELLRQRVDAVRAALVPDSIVPTESIQGRGGELVARFMSGNVTAALHTESAARSLSSGPIEPTQKEPPSSSADPKQEPKKEDHPLSKDEIKKLKADWKDYFEKCSKKFAGLMRDLGLDIKTATPEEIDQAILKKFDKDKDGVLSGTEAVKMIKEIMPWGIARGLLIDKLGELGKGKFMSSGELAEAIRKMAPMLAQLQEEGLLPAEIVEALTRPASGSSEPKEKKLARVESSTRRVAA